MNGVLQEQAQQNQCRRSDASLIVCAHAIDRWTLLESAIESAKQERPSEIIVVIDHNPTLFDRAQAAFGSSTSENGIASTTVPIRVFENSQAQGLSGARNVGINAASSSIVAFLDDDAEALPGWLDHLILPFQDTNVVAVGGRAHASRPESFPSWWPTEFNWVVGCSWTGLPETLTPVRNVIGCSMAFLRDPVIASGGFRSDFGRKGENAGGCEETELCIRLHRLYPSSRVMFEPQAVVTHHIDIRRLNIRYYVRRCFAEGKAKAAIMRIEGQSALGPETSFVGQVVRTSAVTFFRGLLKLDAHQVLRSCAVVVGLASTAFGFVIGRTSGSKR